MLLESAIAPSYASLTYPLFRPRLRTLDQDDTIVAIGVSRGTQPIGLALAEICPDQSAIVLSLYVNPDYRRTGVGTTLLAELEHVLHQRGCTKVALAYSADIHTPSPIEKLVNHQGWTIEPSSMRLYYGTITSMRQAPWWYDYRLPEAFTIFPFAELTVADYEDIQQQQAIQPWYSKDLDPFTADSPIERLNSVGVRYQGRVVGWMVTHRVAADTIRYTSLVMRPDLQQLGRAIALVGVAIQRQLQAAQPERFLCAVQSTNRPMLRFAERRLAPLAVSIKETKQAWKRLSGGVCIY